MGFVVACLAAAAVLGVETVTSWYLDNHRKGGPIPTPSASSEADLGNRPHSASPTVRPHTWPTVRRPQTHPAPKPTSRRPTHKPSPTPTHSPSPTPTPTPTATGSPTATPASPLVIRTRATDQSDTAHPPND